MGRVFVMLLLLFLLAPAGTAIGICGFALIVLLCGIAAMSK